MHTRTLLFTFLPSYWEGGREVKMLDKTKRVPKDVNLPLKRFKRASIGPLPGEKYFPESIPMAKGL